MTPESLIQDKKIETMKRWISGLIALLYWGNPLLSQSVKTVIVEHFTNTRCSICASKNPAFYQTLNSYPQVLHIAFHPSSPYSQCYFSLQNPVENDARTNYYNAFGSTPQVAVNGKLLSPTNPIITSTTLDTVLTETSPIEMHATEEWIAADSIRVRVVVKSTGSVPTGNTVLFAGLAENPINYNAPNGESVHHDVFRKALTSITGNSITLPVQNDSIEFEFAYKVSNDWNAHNLYTLAFIQFTDTKEILNAVKSTRNSGNPNSVQNVLWNQVHLLTNPVQDKLVFTFSDSMIGMNYRIFNLIGEQLTQGQMLTNEVDVSSLPSGIYCFSIGNTLAKFCKQ